MPTQPVPTPTDHVPPTCSHSPNTTLCFNCWIQVYCYSCGGLLVVKGEVVDHAPCFQ